MPRLAALDALRGLTVMGMILVNMPGNAKAVFPLLAHAPWNGLTFADVVFPLFLFMVGLSACLTAAKRLGRGDSRPAIAADVLKRSLILIALGVAINLIFKPSADWQQIRFGGVLQRIGLVYCGCALLLLVMRVRWILLVGAALLILYHLAMTSGPLTPEANVAQLFDARFMPGRLLHHSWDPEGLFTTLGALVTAISGIGAGIILLIWQEKPQPERAPRVLLVAGVLLMLAAWPVSLVFPVNKALWSSSYILLTAGLGCILLFALLWLQPAPRMDAALSLPIAFGRNAIGIYLFHTALIALFIRERYTGGHIGKGLHAAAQSIMASPQAASLLCALVYLGMCAALMRWLHRRKLYWSL
jgi:predicted acyltransferase